MNLAMLQGDRGNHLYIGSKTIITRRDKSGREIFEFFILKDREAKKERGREKNLRERENSHGECWTDIPEEKRENVERNLGG